MGEKSINSASEQLPLLIYIANKIGMNRTDILSTVEIAQDMDFSQQTASRKMQELEEEGLIKKEYSPEGLRIGLTNKGANILKENFKLMKKIFDKPLSKKNSKVTGMVTSGIGEGKFYVQIQRYSEEFERLLGKKAFPGTLNLVVDKDDYKEFLLRRDPIKIEGFRTNERTFGWISCYRIKLQKNNKLVDAIITIPERTSHPENIAEIIAPNYLRKELNVEDNDKVEIV